MDRSSPFLAYLLITLCLDLTAGSHGAVPALVYWQKALPNTPMPAAIRDLLNDPAGVADSKAGASVNVGNSSNGGVAVSTNPSGKTSVNVPTGHGSFNYLYAADQTQVHDDPNAALFFRQEDLHAGAKMSIRFARTAASDAKFLPLKTAESIPFSSAKLPEVLKRFSVGPGSEDAKIMARTIEECEAPAAAGEKRYCATSLESMVNFTTTALGKRDVTVMSTTLRSVHGSPTSGKQVYTIDRASGVRKIAGSKTVACHYRPYVYAVFYCHMTRKTEAYMVSMVAEEGTGVDAVAVCHADTSGWNPRHIAFQVLKVKPGSVPVCHFLPEDHLLWGTKKMHVSSVY